MHVWPDSSVKGNTEEFINLINCTMLKCFCKLNSLIFCLRREWEREQAKEEASIQQQSEHFEESENDKAQWQQFTTARYKHIRTAVVGLPHSQLFVTVTWQLFDRYFHFLTGFTAQITKTTNNLLTYFISYNECQSPPVHYNGTRMMHPRAWRKATVFQGHFICAHIHNHIWFCLSWKSNIGHFQSLLYSHYTVQHLITGQQTCYNFFSCAQFAALSLCTRTKLSYTYI